MVAYNDIMIKEHCKIYQDIMMVVDDAYLIEETRTPEGGLPGVRVSVQEGVNDGAPVWTECDAELTEWVWHLYNDFQAANPPSVWDEIPF